MAEPEGTAGIDATTEAEAPIDVEAAQDAEQEQELDKDADSDGAESTPEEPRRRLVAELLEGEAAVDGEPLLDLQVVAPPLHLEAIDAGQPIYQLDLSSDEPQGEIIEPEPVPGASDVFSPAPADVGAHEAVKQMIVQRDRQLMGAERDGISAYELAVGLDQFVEALLEAARRADN